MGSNQKNFWILSRVCIRTKAQKEIYELPLALKFALKKEIEKP